jgi:glutaminase
MAEAYAEIMGEQPDPQALQTLVAATQTQGAEAPFDALLERLRQELPLLDDNGRELILESAFRVACADGEIEPEEDLQLRAIARALAINEGVLELEIARFQRQLTRPS